MKYEVVAVSRQAVDMSFERSATAAFDAAEKGIIDPVSTPSTFLMDGVPLIHTGGEIKELIVIDTRSIDVHSFFRPWDEISDLRVFLSGVLLAAREIWSHRRIPGRDFDMGHVFFRRPWRSGSLDHRTAVIRAVPRPGRDVDVSSCDLVVVAFGHADDGLPGIEEYPAQDVGAIQTRLERLREVGTEEEIARQRTAGPCAPLGVLTLDGVPRPAWHSYEQWMEKFQGTTQGDFIAQDINRPERIDGPAGSGKTLSLVLRCLTALKKAKSATPPRVHHSAFVVFSEETKTKVLDAFFGPLDEDGFHTMGRDNSPQSVTVTTLLGWSRRELANIADPYSLLADDPAMARRDQLEVVREVVTQDLPDRLRVMGQPLSQELKELLKSKSAVLVDMLAREFGVVIKGMADADLEKYRTIGRPTISIPCSGDADRLFLFSLFENYSSRLQAYNSVDLDDVAISHIKLLQMPLRRKRREALAFDSVFVDEAHCFNPNELAIFHLLSRQGQLPPLVVAVDLPQGLGDKGYHGHGIDDAFLKEVDPALREAFRRVVLPDSKRCSNAIVNLAVEIFRQGFSLFDRIQIPDALRQDRPVDPTDLLPCCRQFDSTPTMLASIPDEVNRLARDLQCKRSDILVAVLDPRLMTLMPEEVRSQSQELRWATDVEVERKARATNSFVLSRADFLHGLEYEAVIVVGASKADFPRISEQGPGAGAAAVFETQRAVDTLYLAVTRARQQVMVLFEREVSTLLSGATRTGRLRSV